MINDVVDVEFRFIEGCEPLPIYGESIVRVIKILQTRKLKVKYVGLLGDIRACEWGEWEDVPFIRE